MLGKVFKYEMKSAGRILVPAFGLGLALSVFLRLITWLGPLVWQGAGALLDGVASMFAILLAIGVLVLPAVVLTIRFYQSLSGREAYLNFTLPVSAGTHLAGRLLSALVYTAASLLAALAVAKIAIPGLTMDTLFGQGMTVNVGGDVTTVLPAEAFPQSLRVGFVVLMAVSMLISLVLNLLQCYAAIALGGQVAGGKIVGSVVAYFALNFVEGILSLLLLAIPIGVFMGQVGGMQNLWNGLAALPQAQMVVEISRASVLFAGCTLAVSILFGVVHFFLCRYLYTKRLNVQ